MFSSEGNNLIIPDLLYDDYFSNIVSFHIEQGL